MMGMIPAKEKHSKKNMAFRGILEHNSTKDGKFRASPKPKPKKNYYSEEFRERKEEEVVNKYSKIVIEKLGPLWNEWLTWRTPDTIWKFYEAYHELVSEESTQAKSAKLYLKVHWDEQAQEALNLKVLEDVYEKFYKEFKELGYDTPITQLSYIEQIKMESQNLDIRIDKTTLGHYVKAVDKAIDAYQLMIKNQLDKQQEEAQDFLNELESL